MPNMEIGPLVISVGLAVVAFLITWLCVQHARDIITFRRITAQLRRDAARHQQDAEHWRDRAEQAEARLTQEDLR